MATTGRAQAPSGAVVVTVEPAIPAPPPPQDNVTITMPRDTAGVICALAGNVSYSNSGAKIATHGTSVYTALRNAGVESTVRLRSSAAIELVWK